MNRIILEWYPRDASWHNRPNVRSAKKLHLYGRKRREGIEPLCGRNAVICSDLPWDNPPETMKCKNCLRIKIRSL